MTPLSPKVLTTLIAALMVAVVYLFMNQNGAPTAFPAPPLGAGSTHELAALQDSIQQISRSLESVKTLSCPTGSDGVASVSSVNPDLLSSAEAKLSKIEALLGQLHDSVRRIPTEPAAAVPGAVVTKRAPQYGVELPCFDYFKEPEAYSRFNGRACPYTTANTDSWPGMPHICQYLSIECRAGGDGPEYKTSNSIFGLGSNRFWHMTSHADIMVFELILSKYSDVDVFVELGTASGISSLFFGMAMRARGGKFYSFDIVDKRAPESKVGWLDNMEFIQEDILHYPGGTNPKIGQLIRTSKQRALLFADNGNKIYEVNHYSDTLKKGDLLVTHDWTKEISMHQIDGAIRRNGFSNLFFEFAEHLGSETRAFIKTT